VSGTAAGIRLGVNCLSSSSLMVSDRSRFRSLSIKYTRMFSVSRRRKEDDTKVNKGSLGNRQPATAKRLRLLYSHDVVVVIGIII
jgi:hypothetical protein